MLCRKVMQQMLQLKYSPTYGVAKQEGQQLHLHGESSKQNVSGCGLTRLDSRRTLLGISGG